MDTDVGMDIDVGVDMGGTDIDAQKICKHNH